MNHIVLVAMMFGHFLATGHTEITPKFNFQLKNVDETLKKTSPHFGIKLLDTEEEHETSPLDDSLQIALVYKIFAKRQEVTQKPYSAKTHKNSKTDKENLQKLMDHNTMCCSPEHRFHKDFETPEKLFEFNIGSQNTIKFQFGDWVQVKPINLPWRLGRVTGVQNFDFSTFAVSLAGTNRYVYLDDIEEIKQYYGKQDIQSILNYPGVKNAAKLPDILWWIEKINIYTKHFQNEIKLRNKTRTLHLKWKGISQRMQGRKIVSFEEMDELFDHDKLRIVRYDVIYQKYSKEPVQIFWFDNSKACTRVHDKIMKKAKDKNSKWFGLEAKFTNQGSINRNVNEPSYDKQYNGFEDGQTLRLWFDRNYIFDLVDHFPYVVQRYTQHFKWEYHTQKTEEWSNMGRWSIFVGKLGGTCLPKCPQNFYVHNRGPHCNTCSKKKNNSINYALDWLRNEANQLKFGYRCNLVKRNDIQNINKNFDFDL